MTRQRYVLPAHSQKPSKLMMFIASIIACVLPYYLITTFSGKRKTNPVKEQVIEQVALPTQTPKSPNAKTETAKSQEAQSQKKSVIAEPKPEPEPKPVITKVTEPPQNDGWTTITTRPGDSLAVIFKRMKLSGQTLHQIMNHNRYASTLTRIKPKQALKFLIKNQQLEQMILVINPTQHLDVVAESHGYKTTMHQQAQKMETREEYMTATVQYSLYNTAKRQNIPYKLIQQMMDILKWEINFAKDVRGGDHFSIIYEANYKDHRLVSIGDIIAVSYTNRGVKHQALRHESASGEVDYYTPKGQSLKEGFSRYPVKFSRINSPFSLSRMHPILHYNRPHKGIDLAAPMGSPIYATGDGRVDMMGYESGYGNVIKISHHNKLYTSVYAHLLKFKKGLFRGSYVKRGQIIGFVGKSGLASGPHCHYEFHVNHRPKNPSTVPLPHATPVPSSDLAAFKKNADKLIEHLKLFEEAHLDSKQKRSVG